MTDGVMRRATRARRWHRAAGASTVPTLEQFFDFRLSEFEIGCHPYFSLGSPWYSTFGFFWHRHEANEGLAVASDHNVLSCKGALNQARERGLGLMHVDDLGHRGRSI